MRLSISVNNDQNIGRVSPKMNDDCQYENESQAILLKNESENSFLDQIKQNNLSEFKELPKVTEVFPNYVENEEIYSENSEVSSSDANCQTAESEVITLKEWLILHNDLIQQQNEEIIEKDHHIYLLQRENEMLKERLLCIEKGIPYEPKQQSSADTEESNTIEDTLSEDMTQDSCGQYEDEGKENLEQDTQQSDNVVTCSLEINNFPTHHINDIESQVDTTIHDFVEDSEFKEDYLVNDLSDSESEIAECTKDNLSEYNFTVNNFCEFDSMKNIKMSIKRKRVSSLSVLSNNEPSLLGEKTTLRRSKKKRRRLGKDLEILTSKDPYFVNNSNEDSCVDPEPSEIAATASLEVPRWRVKHYTSCYTMEGTENLDDEVYNKRHMRLEVDERRRKRWDVQRIREQRVIEKLKQRQERIASGSKGESDQDTLTSLWPMLDDVKFLEVVDELPVSAFGHPIPKTEVSNFVLPWLNNPSVLTRKTNSKRSSSAKRRKRLRSTR